MKSLHRAAITWIFYDRLRHFIFGSRVPAGCGRWSTVSIRGCFKSWIRKLWPGRHDLIAIDGKTSRRTHNKRKGLKVLHTLSAYATNGREHGTPSPLAKLHEILFRLVGDVCR
jgi:hypothetical protein